MDGQNTANAPTTGFLEESNLASRHNKHVRFNGQPSRSSDRISHGNTPEFTKHGVAVVLSEEVCEEPQEILFDRWMNIFSRDVLGTRSLFESLDSSTSSAPLTIATPRRLLKDTTPLQRGIIRHLIVVLDLSSAMTEKDLRPSRFLLTLRYAEDFVTEYFEQNPISQLAFIGMRDGLATRISDISGNPSEHIATLQSLREKEPIGDASLQNALEMARGALLYACRYRALEKIPNAPDPVTPPLTVRARCSSSWVPSSPPTLAISTPP